MDAESGDVHALNPTAALIWQCLDGESWPEEIISDLAEVFDAPLDRVSDDVTALIQTFVAAGLLDGVDRGHRASAARNAVPTPDGAVGLPVGQAVRLGGKAEQRTYGRPQRTLLVNWSSACSFCRGILPELASLQSQFRQEGVRILLIDRADPAVTRAQLDDLGIVAEVAVTELSPFADMGTPAAYLLDEESKVASKLAYGASEVIRLARSLVPGIPGADQQYGGFRLPSTGGVCGPAATYEGRDWQRTSAYQIGSYKVGIRANTAAAEEAVAAAFAPYRLPSDTPVQANFSVILSDSAERGRRDLNLLLAGSRVVARSRSPVRVLEALAGHLSCLLDSPAHLIRIDAVGAVGSGGKAVLLPKAILSSLERVQGSLRRLDLALVDGPFAHVDPGRCELVVSRPSIQLNRSALSSFPGAAAGESEPLPVQPGRFPLRYWLLGVGEGNGHDLSPAGMVARALGQVVTEPSQLAELIEPIAGLIAAVEVQTVASGTPAAMLAELTAWRGAA